MPSRDHGKNGKRAAETSGPDWCRIETKVSESDAADVYIYGRIGGGFFSDGLSAKDFAEQIKDLAAGTLNVYINSPGGSVFDGLAIRSALTRHPAAVNVVVDGLAASAASFIAQAGDTVTMMPNSQMMIHDASSYVDIFASVDKAELTAIIAELEQMGEMLDRQSDNVAQIYADAAGRRGLESDAKAWRQLMLDETWYFAEEAVAAGLADRVEGDEGEATDRAAARSGDVVAVNFRYRGREDAPPPRAAAAVIPETTPEPAAETPDVPAHDLEKIRNQIKKEAAL